MKKKPINLWLEKLSLLGILALLIMSVIVPLVFKDENYRIWTELSSNIGIALFSALSISKFLQKEAKDLIFTEIPLLQRSNEIGITDFPKDGNICELDFNKSNLFVIVMNDGKYFIAQNAESLCERFRNKNLVTTFIILDEKSEAVKMLRSANGKEQDESYYKNKINQTINEIKEYAKKYSKHKFKIYLYPNGYFRTSIVLTDSQAIIGTYRNAPGKGRYPIHMLISKYGDELDAIKEDVENLKKDSREYELK